MPDDDAPRPGPSHCVLLVKTVHERYEQIERAIRNHHSYEVPEIVRVDLAGGLPDYLAWITAVTAPR